MRLGDDKPRLVKKALNFGKLDLKNSENAGENTSKDEEVDKASKVLRCDICDIQSSSMRKLERHRRLCHESLQQSKTIFRCVQCKKSFNQFAKLLIHKYSHNRQGGSVCNLCRERFVNIKGHHQEYHIKPSENETTLVEYEIII